MKTSETCTHKGFAVYLPHGHGRARMTHAQKLENKEQNKRKNERE
jgi:hypothetical protein